nr:MAG TPA: hypothetical protein [Caudoviricetes sp.]
MISILIFGDDRGGRGQIPDGKGQKDRRLTFFHTAAG